MYYMQYKMQHPQPIHRPNNSDKAIIHPQSKPPMHFPRPARRCPSHPSTPTACQPPTRLAASHGSPDSLTAIYHPTTSPVGGRAPSSGLPKVEIRYSRRHCIRLEHCRRPSSSSSYSYRDIHRGQMGCSAGLAGPGQCVMGSLVACRSHSVVRLSWTAHRAGYPAGCPT